jgi:hypothetical protein
MPPTSLKIDRRVLIASAMIAAFVGATSVTVVITTSPAQAAEKGGGEKGGGESQRQAGQQEQHKGCDKYDKNSQDYKNCVNR